MGGEEGRDGRRGGERWEERRERWEERREEMKGEEGRDGRRGGERWEERREEMGAEMGSTPIVHLSPQHLLSFLGGYMVEYWWVHGRVLVGIW